MADAKGLFDDAYNEIAFKQELVSITATWWAVGRSPEELEKEASQQLKEKYDIEYKPDKKK